MSSNRRIAVVAGVFFIVAAVAAVVGLALYDPVLSHPRFVVGGSAGDAPVLWGAFFEVLLAISVIGTAVTLFPVVRRQNEAIALGYVAGRIVEAVVITVGIISLVSVVTLRQQLAGAGGAGALTVGRALVAVHDWTFLFGPNLAIGLNTLMLAYLMYRSRLVPRAIPLIGLVGGPLVFVSGIGVLFGLYEQVSLAGAIAALPVAAWEMSLAVYLIVKGFRPAPIVSGEGMSAMDVAPQAA
jgi:hypothetical protein